MIEDQCNVILWSVWLYMCDYPVSNTTFTWSESRCGVCHFDLHLVLMREAILKNYSWTSVYQTRIIRTSAYIEIALWSRPPAIVYRIYRTRVYRIPGYIDYAAPPHTSTASFISKLTHLTLDGRWSAGEMWHHTPPTLSSHRPPTVTGADALQQS